MSKGYYMAVPQVLTVDNGASRTRMAQGGEELDYIEQYDTPQDYDEAIRTFAAAARLVLNGQTPDAIGFSVAGEIIDGRIASAGQLQAYGWVGREFRNDVAAEFGIDPEGVVLLNDCAAGAKAESVARHPDNRTTGRDEGITIVTEDETGEFEVLSTGKGGALYRNGRVVEDGTIIPREPGHIYLRPGAKCGCGQEGHVEAHCAGSGILAKYGVRGENIPHDDARWHEIKDDFHWGTVLTLDSYQEQLGLSVKVTGFTGSVALGGPDMLSGLQEFLNYYYGPKGAPRIEEAYYGEKSGLYGAAFAADDLLRTS